MNDKIYTFDNSTWIVSTTKSTATINDIEYPLELLQSIIGDCTGICTFKDCDSKVYARGYCNKHYIKFRDLKKLEIETAMKCMIEGCDEIHHGKGYCSTHYWHYVKRPKLVESGKIKDKRKKTNNI